MKTVIARCKRVYGVFQNRRFSEIVCKVLHTLQILTKMKESCCNGNVYTIDIWGLQENEIIERA